MEALIIGIANWRTTLIGLLTAIVLYEAGVGNKIPETKQEWAAFVLGVLALALGITSKDAKVGSRPPVILLAIALSCALTGCVALNGPAIYVKCTGKGALTGTASLGGGLLYGGGGTNSGTLQADCGDGFEYYRGPKKPKDIPAVDSAGK